ncbi:hypothetical protein ACIGQE_20625 [Streptomyces sp. NPDC053429]|uniref:hypothetical protein n=1 Tax=Streptomyces sp. NPDC053429 TaxID=3365702 RepID=UPI0037D0D553
MITASERCGWFRRRAYGPRQTIVDRLTFNGAIIETGTESYRLAQTKAKRQQAKK